MVSLRESRILQILNIFGFINMRNWVIWNRKVSETHFFGECFGLKTPKNLNKTVDDFAYAEMS